MTSSKIKKEVSLAQQRLNMERMKGSSNICVDCQHTGHFGSIIRYKAEDKSIWIICGWCGTCQLIQTATGKIR